MKERVDRRVRYTKALLRHALVEMMQTQHISAISVKALCDKADVHRSTFYAHYRDQYDLLEQLEQEVFENVNERLYGMDFDDTSPLSTQKISRILEYGKQNADVLTVLIGDNSTMTFQRNIIKSLDIVSLTPDQSLDERTMEYVLLFGINGCLSIISKWLKDGMREPTMYIAELITQVLFHGIRSVQREWSNSP